ncbi:hypothetical protein IVB18_08940 [Bradyrhizobium sp. 186]|uniref:phage exclusion protein Lit family protein n=1 Tax=Bradyrhizobium sp. 186 TaxID=2782654 RepID=UPI0020008EE2|nr:phage exclusion protein Lit family protein [Bradyrhizobium sp. 186]UPK37405.1 hypothetical protein IVB18_08940 [Bradyrhizobium sp. 186]
MLFAAMAAAPSSSTPPGPFEAFGVDASIYQDESVKDVSSKCLNGALCFLLLHELGHLALNHTIALTNIASQEQERAADGYALDAMAELHILALGVPFLFFATAAMEQGQMTHPTSGSRIVAIGQRLESEALRYVDRNDANALPPTSCVGTVANYASWQRRSCSILRSGTNFFAWQQVRALQT